MRGARPKSTALRRCEEATLFPREGAAARLQSPLPLPLVPGTRLGPYEIVAPLGAGGMGEVYRAHDSFLNRDVAIKVLLASVADDPDRLARFRREA